MLARLVLGTFGALYLLFPKRTVDAIMRLATTRDSDVELRPWVYAVARAEGLVVLAWVLRGLRREARSRAIRAPTSAAASSSTE